MIIPMKYYWSLYHLYNDPNDTQEGATETALRRWSELYFFLDFV